ncbi:glycosyltransferase family 2 protein [Peribacillus kribbensis]|uniref:glycosyltransferase family 2 protein n=1 Tax=Peribacillus kribbensis TaxID=356658 RepID=UPI000402FC9A|nr:glycosyltransferase family A protein [Peribacillus kribbensis]
MKLLTIFTPTFNRAYCLHKCYESLLRQTDRNFIWLIIDDGSTDGTKELVKKWIREENLEIHYIWQENQGMHGAHNTAYNNILTELNICIDSDDYMPDDAVEAIISFWKKHGSERVSGFVGLDAYNNGQIVGSTLPENLISSTLFDLYNKHGVKGDKKIVYRTELTKHFPYPIFKGENYVGLAYKYYKLDQDYELLLLNKVLCCVEYLPDGSSHNMLRQYKRNPKGFSFYRRELMKLPSAGHIFKYRQAVHYVSSSLFDKNIWFLKESPNKFFTLVAIPLGITLHFYIKAKTVFS